MGIIRASARLLVMAGVMAAVLIAAIVAGVGTTTAIAIGVVLAGAAGVVMVARRPRTSAAANEIAAMMAPPVVAPPVHTPSHATAIEAMSPSSLDVDPEAGVPRWRRKSLIEARRSDPRLNIPTRKVSRRFSEHDAAGLDIRVVRYAIVPVLDRPDEVLGLRLSDLDQGDEVGVVGASGAFLEITCPNGDRGWVHRTTLGQKVVVEPLAFKPVALEADDALTTLLQARGLS